MSRSLVCRVLIVPLLVGGLTSIIGCGGDSAATMIQDANRSNIQRLTNLYTRHQMQMAGQGPKSEQDFRKFIQGLDAETLKNMSVDLANLDSMFVSERDQQPLDIRYGVKSSFRDAAQGLIFERVGVEGVRQVGISTIAIKDIADDQQYADLKAGKPFVENSASGNSIPGVTR